MTKARTQLLVLAPALLLVLAVGAFFVLFERVDVEQERPRSRMAQLNPALALQRTLDRQGLPSQARFGLGSLPPTDRLIFLPSIPPEHRIRLWPRLLPWVEEGGHLVLGLSPGEEPWGDLYEWLGLGIEVELEEEGPQGVGELTSESLPQRRVELLSSGSLWLDEGYGYGSLRDWEDAGGRIHALRLGVGEGRVTVLLDPSPLHNEAIARHDHILWAADLFELASKPAGMLVVLEGGVDRGLLSLAWAHTRPLLGGLAFLLVLAIARANARFLPPRAAPAPVRRDLLEHMAAAGRFLWERGLVVEMLGPIRRAVPGSSALSLPTDERSLVAFVRTLQEQWRSR